MKTSILSSWLIINERISLDKYLNISSKYSWKFINQKGKKVIEIDFFIHENV